MRKRAGTGVTQVVPGARLMRLSDVLLGPPVSVPNGSEARWARTLDGRTWVWKGEVSTGFEALLAESVSWLLGQALGVRQPQVAVAQVGGEWSWLSEAVQPIKHWSADDRDFILNLDEVGRMLALDALVANGDRHAQNVLVELHPDPTSLRLWAIDAGNALVGQIDDYLALGLEPPDPRNHARGFPVDALRSGALAAAEVASRLDHAVLRRWVAEGCSLVAEPRIDDLTEAVYRRCQNAHPIILRYIEALEHPR